MARRGRRCRRNGAALELGPSATAAAAERPHHWRARLPCRASASARSSADSWNAKWSRHRRRGQCAGRARTAGRAGDERDCGDRGDFQIVLSMGSILPHLAACRNIIPGKPMSHPHPDWPGCRATLGRHERHAAHVAADCRKVRLRLTPPAQSLVARHVLHYRARTDHRAHPARHPPLSDRSRLHRSRLVITASDRGHRRVRAEPQTVARLLPPVVGELTRLACRSGSRRSRRGAGSHPVSGRTSAPFV